MRNPIGFIGLAGCLAVLSGPGGAQIGPASAQGFNGTITATWIRDVISTASFPNAVANDGSPYAFFVQPGRGADANKWIIHLDQGGYCNDAMSCQMRARMMPQLVASRQSQTLPAGDGILSSDPAVSPYFANYTHVWLPYSSSDLWSGNTDRMIGGMLWHFRGKAILEAVIDRLKRGSVGGGPTLAMATDVLITGTSAGSIGVSNNLDRIAAMLSPARVMGVADSGWKLWDNPLDYPINPLALRTLPDGRDRQFQFPGDLSFWNMQLDDSCVAANASMPANCLRQEFAFEYIKTPMFVYADQRDPIALTTRGIALAALNTPAGRSAADELGASVRDSMTKVPAHFSPSIGQHGILTEPNFSTVAVNGVTFVQALHGYMDVIINAMPAIVRQ